MRLNDEKILLAIPTFNCENQIERVLSQLIDFNFNFSEIIIYDNCSSDSTYSVAKAFVDKHFAIQVSQGKIAVISNSNNLGFGGTHKKAFEYCMKKNISKCLVLHGDDQAKIQDFGQILFSKKWLQYDHIFGSRFSWNSKTMGYSKFRILGNYILNMIASMIFFKSIPDLGGSGLNIYGMNVSQIQNGRFYRYSNDLTFHVDFLLDSILFENRFLFYPISWSEVDQISNVKVFSQGFKVVKKLKSYFFEKHSRPKK